jgi:hypothetical protein
MIDVDLQNLTFQGEDDRFAAAKWFDHWTSIAKFALNPSSWREGLVDTKSSAE